LLKIGRLEAHKTDARQIALLLESSERCIQDARSVSISLETRFDAAYRAIMQCAMIALWANGYRPLKSAPGHHQTMIQSLVAGIGLETEEMQFLDTMRIKRNAIDYTGELVDEGSVDECVAAAESLIVFLKNWLSKEHPDLV
jgi:hypothetical protein